MTRCQRVARPIAQCLQQPQSAATQSMAARSFSGSASRRAEPPEPAIEATPPVDKLPTPVSRHPQDTDFRRRKLDPNVTTLWWAEKELMRQGTPPVGSRRRRAALRTSQDVPFELMPYQCFQEARKILQADREDKIRQIAAGADKIKKWEAIPGSELRGGEKFKQRKLASWRRFVEEQKILADINDPLVKRRFEDGLGDMSKPIYRYLAQKRWEGYPHRLIMQRIEQLHIVPDVLPKFEPIMDTQLFFRQYRVAPGEIVDSVVSEVPPRLRVQVFDKHERLVSIAVMDSDVPLPDEDAFGRRCHYLAANVPLSPLINSLPLAKMDAESQLAVPWLPAFSQKGSPYHRLSIFILEQKAGERLDVAKLRELYEARDGFSLKSFRDKFGLTPIGFNLFRSEWDKGMAGVMERAGIPGADVELKRRRVVSLKPPRKARGWEAKRQGPKYKHLWKYTKRIASPRKRNFVR